MKVFFLILTIAFSFSCKQKTEFKEKIEQIKLQKKNNVYPEELKLSVSERIWFEIIDFYEDEDQEIYKFGSLEYFINKDNKKDNDAIITSNEEIKNVKLEEVDDNSQWFNILKLSDFCEQTDSSTNLLRLKLSMDDYQGSPTEVYSFILTGMCNNEQVQCALSYVIPEKYSFEGLMENGLLDEDDFEDIVEDMEEEIESLDERFYSPYAVVQTNGVNGQAINCQAMQKIARPIEGCGDPAALNYDPEVNLSYPEECEYPVPGCTDPLADNFNFLANVNDGSCNYSSAFNNGFNNAYQIGYNDSLTCEEENNPFSDRGLDDYAQAYETGQFSGYMHGYDDGQEEAVCNGAGAGGGHPGGGGWIP